MLLLHPYKYPAYSVRVETSEIPSIARTLAKGMTQVRQATNDIKSEIQKSVDVDIENPTKSITKEIKKEVDGVKKDFLDLEDSIRRDL